jgi:hypothetical protein
VEIGHFGETPAAGDALAAEVGAERVVDLFESVDHAAREFEIGGRAADLQSEEAPVFAVADRPRGLAMGV